MFAALVAASIKDTGCTIDQFKIAVHKGMMTAEIYSANAPNTYNKWVRTYLDSVKMELAAHRNNQSFQPYEMSEEEKLNTAIEHLVTMYHKFKSGQSFLDGGSAGYLWLEKIGQINVSIDEKADMFEKSKDRAIAAIKAKRDNAERYEARTIQSLLNAIEQRPKDIPELRFEQIKICRDDLLRQYFRANEVTADFLKQCYEAV
jgi:HPt (histidine-containing phosphotransfer) domain-containing protein